MKIKDPYTGKPIQLSVYAFAHHGDDALLYNSIHDLEKHVEVVNAENEELLAMTQLQLEVGEWCDQRWPRKLHGRDGRIAKLREEVRELIEAIRHHEHLSDEASRQMLADEIGDVRIVLADICNMCGIDGDAAALAKLAKARAKHGEKA